MEITALKTLLDIAGMGAILTVVGSVGNED